MKKLLLLAGLLFCGVTFSQEANDYQYIVVPAKFSFLNEPNKYNLNALTKMVFEKQGFQVFYDTDKLPLEISENRCKALYADMIEENTMFATKIKLQLKDCQNKSVFMSQEGTSRDKSYSKAYLEAFRGAGKSVSVLQSAPKTVISNPVVTTTQVESVKIEDKTVVVTTKTVSANSLYAQPIANGYQLVDTTPKVIMKVFKTTDANVFIAQKETLSGVMINKAGSWYFEYYLNDKLVSEKMEIKF
ncbi:hypothetical protein [Flavobacterium pedocola]